MPRHNGFFEQTDIVNAFEQRHRNGEAGALLMWSLASVDALWYLDDIDLALEGGTPPAGGHPRDVVDIAHARWATGTCITCLDLCAAALGRVYCKAKENNHELDLANLDPSRTKNPNNVAKLRSAIRPAALQWVDGVLNDAKYSRISECRRALTHDRLPRNIFLHRRIELKLNTGKASIRSIVQDARDVATNHVGALLNVLPAL